MDLWIRSQDRKRLIKPNRLHVKVDPRSREGYIFESANSLRYGTYESEERAIEVLDEIQKYMLNGSFAKITNGLGEIIELKPNPIFVYEMPKE